MINKIKNSIKNASDLKLWLVSLGLGVIITCVIYM